MPSKTAELARYERLILEAISSMSLDLDGLTVYTEGGTGAYRVTAPMAARAGAEAVYALVADSPHGTREDSVEQTVELAEHLGVAPRVRVVDEKRASDVGSADVVTNSGHVRPIDETTVGWMRSDAVVPLMYETWEFRPADVALEACWQRGIPVLGTDESEDRVLTQHYVRALAAKLALENEIEVFGSRIVVVGGGPMARHAVAGLEALGADVSLVARSINDEGLRERRDAETLSDPDILATLERADALFVVEHWEDYEILGAETRPSAGELHDRNPAIAVIHICGAIDGEQLVEQGVTLVPDEPRPFGHMSFTLGYVGPRPIVNLQCAGLRVGELMSRRRQAGSDVRETIDAVADHPLVDRFSPPLLERFGPPAASTGE